MNAGWICIEHLDDLPPIKTGAALGGATYVALVLSVQSAGAAYEAWLLWKLRRHGFLPSREAIVLVYALIVELGRMFFRHEWVSAYFSEHTYAVFRVPILCENAPNTSMLAPDTFWIGADGREYCRDASPYGALTEYYIATSREAFSIQNPNCPVYTATSALLDYDEELGNSFWTGGHNRYSHLGWVVGGEFAMLYLLGTLVNEVADNLFVVPLTSSAGWLCKVLAIGLELFHLSLLCPAWVFVHGDCLRYTYPLGLSLQVIRNLTTTFGYLLWLFPFAYAFLVVLGICLLLLTTVALCVGWSTVVCLLEWECCEDFGWRFAQGLSALAELPKAILGYNRNVSIGSIGLAVSLTFCPLLLIGVFLGGIVLAGTSAKVGAGNPYAVLSFFFDLLFKIFALVVFKLFDMAPAVRWVLHRFSAGVRRRLGRLAFGRGAAASGGDGGAPPFTGVTPSTTGGDADAAITIE